MKRAPTLNDVAELAKVSRSLASLVFQESPKVSATSRAAVLKAADKLGYQPNESARRLKSSVTKTIGVVLTDIHNPYYGGIFYGVESSASELDYKLLIGNSGFESEELNQKPEKIRSRQLATLKTIRSQMVDGIICSALRTTVEELHAAAKNSPVILLGHSSGSLLKDFDVVVTDEQNGAIQILDHLMDFGHKRIAHISGGVDEGNSAYNTRRKNGEPLYEQFVYEPNSTDWYGRWRCKDSSHNDWGIDRESQRNGKQFTGIGNITIQDQAVTESMGPITDHSFEHLSPADQMIARTRRSLLIAARSWKTKLTAPPGSERPEVYFGARAGSFLAEKGVSLEAAYSEQLISAVRWT